MQGRVLREMGLHAHFLESGRRPSLLLPLLTLPGKPCSFGI